jgi:site-specific recombinase XerC
MAATHQKSEAILRGARMLRTALGPAIARFLEDPAIVEVMLNPDGRLWVDRLSDGLSDTGERLSPSDGERIKLGMPIHPHMLRHSTGFKLANDGQDTRAIQLYLGHRNIQHTVLYTQLTADRFNDFWKD